MQLDKKKFTMSESPSAQSGLTKNELMEIIEQIDAEKKPFSYSHDARQGHQREKRQLPKGI